MSLPRQHVSYDERRNTSRVFPVTVQDGENARRAVTALRRTDPALVQWIEDGHPRLTEAEHIQRFGVPYEPPKRSKPRPWPSWSS